MTYLYGVILGILAYLVAVVVFWLVVSLVTGDMEWVNTLIGSAEGRGL